MPAYVTESEARFRWSDPDNVHIESDTDFEGSARMGMTLNHLKSLLQAYIALENLLWRVEIEREIITLRSNKPRKKLLKITPQDLKKAITLIEGDKSG
jgi:hypothetical protein